MRLTKLGHACVRIEHEGGVLVIDPGGWTEPEAVDGADAVLITHEHPDHYDAGHLRRTDAPVLTIEAVARRIRDDAPDVAERLSVLAPGDSLSAAGLPTEVVGAKHAVIHPELPHFDNSGYLVDVGGTTVFHPGDALTVPDRPVDVLLVPVSAPWLKVSEAIDFARDVGAARNVAIHDAIYSEAGLGIVGGQMQGFLEPRDQAYERLTPGTDL